MTSTVTSVARTYDGRRQCCYAVALKLHRFDLLLYLLQTGLYNIDQVEFEPHPARMWYNNLQLSVCIAVFAWLSWNSIGPTPTRKPTPTLGMRLSCNFVNVYTLAYRIQFTFACAHARISNRNPREEKRACRTSWRTSRRGSSCVSGS